MGNSEALSKISKLCQFVFDNEQNFRKEFNIFVSVSDDFRNVSFSGNTCHICIYNTFNEPRNIYLDIQDVLVWINELVGES